MPSTKNCSCTNHESIAGEGVLVQNIQKCKKYKKSAIEFLISNGLMESHSKYLCCDCYEYGLSQTNVHTYIVSEICEMINAGTIDDSDVSLLAGSLAQKFKTILSENSVSPDVALLKKLNAKEEIDKINTVVYNFLSSLCIDENEQEDEILNAYEHLSNLSNKYYIGPLNFALNILFHFITASKQVLQMRSKYSPSGSYTKALDYLSKNSKTQAQLKFEQDSVLVFDNNQVLARSWNVRLNSKALICVITTVACLIPPNISQYQQMPDLMPCNWMNNINDVMPSNQDIQVTLRESRNTNIERELQAINSNLVANDGPLQGKKTKLTMSP